MTVEERLWENRPFSEPGSGFVPFFPRSWNQQQVVDTINAAYDRRNPMQNGLYLANVNGITIQMRLDPNGKIVTAYPHMMEG